MHVDDGTETRSFRQVVHAELDSPSEYPLAAENYYVRIGLYAYHLARYIELFGQRQLSICFYDDLERSAAKFMRELFNFIGVNPDFAVDTSSRFNTLGVRKLEQRPQTRGLKRLFKRLRSLIPERLYYLIYRGYSASVAETLPVPPMPRDILERLRDAYAADIQALQTLTGRDLSHWLRA
jgi:hypothetical protein